MGSDNLPILANLHHNFQTIKASKQRPNWCWKKANWDDFTKEIELSIGDFDVTNTITKAAEKNIKRVVDKKADKFWMNSKLSAERKETNSATAYHIPQRMASTVQLVNEKTREAEEKWKEFIEGE